MRSTSFPFLSVLHLFKVNLDVQPRISCVAFFDLFWPTNSIICPIDTIHYFDASVPLCWRGTYLFSKLLHVVVLNGKFSLSSVSSPIAMGVNGP